MKKKLYAVTILLALFCPNDVYTKDTKRAFTIKPRKDGYSLILPEKLVERFPSKFTTKVALYPAKNGNSPAVLEGFGSKKAKNEILFETTAKFNVAIERMDLNLGIFAKAHDGPNNYSTADFNFGPKPLNYSGSGTILPQPHGHQQHNLCTGCAHAAGLCQYSSPWHGGGQGICYCIIGEGCL